MRPITVPPTLNRADLRHLLRVGAPIFAVGQAYAWWTVLDRTLVLRLAGSEGLGLYGLATLALAAVNLLPAAVTQITYPWVVEMYGRDESIGPMFSYLAKPTLALVVLMIPVTAVGWVLLPPLVRIALPNYVAGVPAAQWTLLLALLMALHPVNNVFVTAKKQHLYFAAIAVGMAVYLFALHRLVRGSVELVAFPKAMVAGRAAFLGFCYAFILVLVGREHRGARVRS